MLTTRRTTRRTNASKLLTVHHPTTHGAAHSSARAAVDGSRPPSPPPRTRHGEREDADARGAPPLAARDRPRARAASPAPRPRDPPVVARLIVSAPPIRLIASSSVPVAVVPEQASFDDRGAYVVRVRLPGVSSSSAVSVDVVNGDVLEVFALTYGGDDDDDDASSASSAAGGWRLTHPLPFAVSSSSSSSARAEVSRVKFSKKSRTLTVAFDGASAMDPSPTPTKAAAERATAPFPPDEPSREYEPSPPPSPISRASDDDDDRREEEEDASEPSSSSPGRSPPPPPPPRRPPPRDAAPSQTLPGGIDFAFDPNLYLCVDATGARGRHLRARRALREGDVVMTCDPLVCAVHDRHAERACAFCYRDVDGGGVRCDACDAALYCGRRCRAADTSHVGECALARRAKTDPRLSSATRGLRLFLRLLYVRATAPGLFDAVKALDSPFRDVSAEKRATYVGMANAVNSMLPPGPARMDVDALAEVMSKVHVNSHGVVDAAGRALGTGVYPPAALFNHSCAPNAVVSFGGADDDGDGSHSDRDGSCSNGSTNNGARLTVRCVSPVEEGEEICIAYAEVYATRETRREALWEKKAFACECRRCADAASARRDAPLGGWRCPRLSACDGVVPDAGDSCLTCGAKCARARSKRDAAERRWIGRHAAALTALRENDHATAVSIACEVVRESDDALCDAHVIRHECRLVLMDAHAALKQWRHAADVSRDVADAMRRFVNVNHPGRAHALRCLGDALVALVDVDERKERRKTVVAKGGGKKKGAAHAHAHAAAVDVSSSAAVALAEAAAAYRRAGAILEIAYGRHHPATTEARDSELAARARMQSLH